VFMAPAFDLGDKEGGIHPRDKQVRVTHTHTHTCGLLLLGGWVGVCTDVCVYVCRPLHITSHLSPPNTQTNKPHQTPSPPSLPPLHHTIIPVFVNTGPGPPLALRCPFHRLWHGRVCGRLGPVHLSGRRVEGDCHLSLSLTYLSRKPGRKRGGGFCADIGIHACCVDIRVCACMHAAVGLGCQARDDVHVV
jgi:hypothetical protein